MNKAIFLDRDGTLNVDDKGYTYKVEDFKLIDGAIEALQLLQREYLLFIITNQSGISRGYYTLEDAERFNARMLMEFAEHGIKIDEVYICPHQKEDGCDCRKPSPKFIKQAAKSYWLDLSKSWMIGDHTWDVACGHNAGTKGVYVMTGHGKKHFDDLEKEGIKPDFIADDVLHAAEHIMRSIGK